MADTTNGAASWAQMTGASADAAPTAETTQGGISWEQMSGQAPAPSGWEKFKGLLAQGETVLGAPKALQGVQQIGQEVKALTNMLVGIPGGVAGVGMDIGSRISSLAIGEDAKSAGVRARATAEHTNALWGKVTGALGLTQDASGSNIERLMTQGIEATDVGGSKLEAATGGVLTKETVQSVRDTLLNALGVKGLGKAPKARPPKPGQGTMDALTADQAIRDSKARVAETAKAKAMEEVAAATAKAETVTKVYEEAIKTRHPLDEAWAGKTKAPATESPAWDTMVKGLVEPEPVPAPQGPGLTPKTRLAEPTVLGQGPDLVVTGMEKLRKGLLLSNAEAKAIRRLGQGESLLAVEPVAPPRATFGERLSTPLPERGPGVVPKTRLAEGTVLSKEPPVAVAELHGVVERLVDTGLAKLQRGELVSSAEAKAIRALKPLPDQGVIVGPNGKPYFQRGAVDPSLLKVLGLMGVGAVAGTAIYNWFQSPGGLSGDNAGQLNPPSLSTEQAAGLAAGLMGATVLRKAPTVFDKMPTAGLIEAMKAGGREAEGAARAIHDSTRSHLERSLWSYKNTIDVEGVVQEAYAKTFEAMKNGEFRGDAKPSTYLYMVAQNLAKNAVRDRKTSPDATSSSSVMSPDGEPIDIAETLTSEAIRTPEQLLQNQQMAERMQASLNKLPEDQRTAFSMAEIEGMPYQEIADQLNIPINTVRSRISRARESLQASLAQYKPERQTGRVDSKLLMVGGAVGGGALIGGALANDASKGSVVGAMLGLMASVSGTGPARAAFMRGTTRIGEVLPELRRALRESEMQASQEVSRASAAISAFVDPVKKLSEEAKTKLDEAYSQADPSGVKAALAGSPEALLGYQKLREFLDTVGERLKAFGRFKEGVPDYLPLLVKDYKGLMEHLGRETREGLAKYLHEANLKSMKTTGKELNEVERSLLVNDYLIRDPATSYLPGFAKHRRLKMTPETRPFYHSMDDALIHYAHAAVEDVAEAKFFGKDLRTSKVNGQEYTNLDNSIGALTDRALREGRLTPEGAVELQAVLRARYGKGKMAPSGWLQDARNVSSMATLGQLGSGLVQTSEGLLSTYHHGIRPAIEAVGIQLTGRGIKPGEFGLANHVIEEVIGKRPTGQALSKLLKLNLLAALDQIGMGQNLTASFVKNRRLAQTASGQAKLMEKWGADYGPDMPQLIEELKQSTVKSRTPLVDSLLYQELSDVRPTSRAEATELYNAHPNARMMYHLKQFMLTQADVLYRDSAKKIASGQPKQVAVGLKNLALYAAALSTVTIPSDAIKNWLNGRGLRLDKIDYVENFTRNFGLSRYTMNKVMRSETPGTEMVQAGQDMLTPPVLSVAKTLMKGASSPKELVPLIPLVGRAAYNREFGGNEKAARNEQLQKRLDLRDAKEARNPSLKAARLRKQAAAKRAAAAKFSK